MSYTSSAAPAIERAIDERLLIDNRPTRRIDQPRGRLHVSKVRGGHETPRAMAQEQMDGQNIGLPEQLVLGDPRGTDRGSTAWLQVLAPGDDVHAKRQSNARDLAADVAQAQHAEDSSREFLADRRLPPTGANRVGFLHEVTVAGKDQCPGQFDGGSCAIAGVGHADAALLRGRHVNRGVARAGGGNQLEAGQALDDRARQRCALSHHANHVKGLESFHDPIVTRHMIGEYGDVGAARHRRPIRRAERNVLVVVEDGDLEACGRHHDAIIVRLIGCPDQAPNSL